MRIRRAFGAVTASGLVLLGATAIAPQGASAATNVTCGQVITASIKLKNDLHCPTGVGLVVQGNNIQVKLDGHTISSDLVTLSVTEDSILNDPSSPDITYTTKSANDMFGGIRVDGSNNLLKGPGTVTGFAAGVVITGPGGGNVVNGLTVSENIGPAGTDFLGDGILIMESSNNTVINNVVTKNGPYSGVATFGDATKNTIKGNTIADNDQGILCGVPTGCTQNRPYGAITFQQDMGVRIEGDGPNGEGATDNVVRANTVTGSGNHGIFVGAYCHLDDCDTALEGNIKNKVINNVSNGNGFGYRVGGVLTGRPAASMFGGPTGGGSGLLFFNVGPNPPTLETVTGNTINGNARHGIDTGGTSGSVFTGNTATGNDVAVGGAATYDALDPIPGCGNTWSANTFGVVNQPCVQ